MIPESQFEIDVEVPLDVPANDIIVGLNQAFQLGIDTDNVRYCYLKCESPTALLRGDHTLRDFGVHTGSRIMYRP